MPWENNDVVDATTSSFTLAITVLMASGSCRGRRLGFPGDEVVQFCSEHDVDLAVVSLTDPDVSELADDTADRIRATGTPTIVGGPGRSLEQLVDEARASTAAAT